MASAPLMTRFITTCCIWAGVRGPAGQQAQTLQFLRVLELSFGALALRDVANDPRKDATLVLLVLTEGDLQRQLPTALMESRKGDSLPGDMPLAGFHISS